MDTIIFLCHEQDEAIEMKLRKHLSAYKYFDFYSNLTPIPGEDILNIKSVLNIAHVVKTIPESPLASYKDPDAAYIFVVQIIIDKVDIALLKKKIKDLESILHTKD